MLARRKFLTFLGIGGGAAAAVALKVKPARPPPTMSTLPDYNRHGFSSDMLAAQREINLRRNLRLRWVEARSRWTAVERERARFHEFMTGEQWTPEQIAEMRHG